MVISPLHHQARTTVRVQRASPDLIWLNYVTASVTINFISICKKQNSPLTGGNPEQDRLMASWTEGEEKGAGQMEEQTRMAQIHSLQQANCDS